MFQFGAGIAWDRGILLFFPHRFSPASIPTTAVLDFTRVASHHERHLPDTVSVSATSIRLEPLPLYEAPSQSLCYGVIFVHADTERLCSLPGSERVSGEKSNQLMERTNRLAESERFANTSYPAKQVDRCRHVSVPGFILCLVSFCAFEEQAAGLLYQRHFAANQSRRFTSVKPW